MKIKSGGWSLFFSLFFYLNSADATPWADWEPGDLVRLQNDLQISESVRLPKGSRFVIHETQTLDPVPVMVYTLHSVGCTPDTDLLPIEMTILSDGNGFEWQKSCLAHFYVEFNDLSNESYFEKLPE